MKTEIKSEKQNPLMKRKELVIEIENPEEATPSKAALQHFMAKQLSKEVEHIEIIDVVQGKGVSKATARLNIWEAKKAKDLAKKEEPKEAPASS